MIEVTGNGPYAVSGLPLVRQRMVYDGTSPVAWETYEVVDTSAEADESGTYWLCRCGQSANKPFCDGSHKRVGFDGTEQAPTSTYAERAEPVASHHPELEYDSTICQHARFCAGARGNVWRLAATDDPEGLAQVAAMMDDCPSGALVRPREPELPTQVAIVADGPIRLTGGISVARSDGEPIEQRRRMVLCRCGQSSLKPLCDGSHSKVGFSDS